MIGAADGAPEGKTALSRGHSAVPATSCKTSPNLAGWLAGLAAVAGQAVVNKAVEAAAAAMTLIASSPTFTRAKWLRDVSEGITRRRARLVELESKDIGKPLPEALADIDFCAKVFRYRRARLCGSEWKRTQTEAVGVAAAITPWNYPLMMACSKVAPALAAGCAVILKPSENTCLSSLELASIAHEVGLPAGALNVVTGGPETGRALTRHAKVDKVSFTGSTRAGREILAACAPDIRRADMELGGKSSMLVFEDTDIPAAVDWAMVGVYCNAGQICSACTRLLVHEKIYDSFLSLLREKIKKVRIGGPFAADGSPSGNNMGPLITAAQRDKVSGYVQRAVHDGGKLLHGGTSAQGPGFFFQPALLEDVPLESKAWNEEIFGPVLMVRKFKNEQEALDIANKTEYGLAGCFFTEDKMRAKRVRRGLRAGVVWHNCNQPVLAHAPWGGMKQSGMGREGGFWGLEAFQETKAVISAQTGFTWKWFG
eukprot:g7838.t1